MWLGTINEKQSLLSLCVFRPFLRSSRRKYLNHLFFLECENHVCKINIP